MSAEINCLDRINSDSFRILKLGGATHLTLLDDEGKYTYALEVNGSVSDSDLRSWLKKWNIEELSDMRLSKNASFTEKCLPLKQKGLLTSLLAKMRHAKLYAANYYENTIFDGIDPADDDDD